MKRTPENTAFEVFALGVVCCSTIVAYWFSPPRTLIDELRIKGG